MKKENSTEYQESEACKKNFPKLAKHLEYFASLYNFCFELQHILNKKTIQEVGKLLSSQMMILMRITDYLRCIGQEITRGYPEQAGTLASSVFELAHTGIYFLYDPDAIEKWWSGEKTKSMPKLIGKNTYKELIEYNYSKFNKNSDLELRVYKELCWMKHSHPVMQDIKIDNKHAQFLVGPYTDERAIHNSQMVIEQSGRLTEFFIAHIGFPENFLSLLQQEMMRERLVMLAGVRAELMKKHIHKN